MLAVSGLKRYTKERVKKGLLVRNLWITCGLSKALSKYQKIEISGCDPIINLPLINWLSIGPSFQIGNFACYF
jgi:hypothetical protein